MPTYRARYWSTTDRPMLGGVMSSRSSVFDTREEAELRLAIAIEVNTSAGRPVEGEIETGNWPAEILLPPLPGGPCPDGLYRANSGEIVRIHHGRPEPAF